MNSRRFDRFALVIALGIAVAPALRASPSVVAVLRTAPPAEISRDVTAFVDKVVPGINATTWTFLLTLATGDPAFLTFGREAPAGVIFFAEEGVVSWVGVAQLNEGSPVPGQLRNVGWATTPQDPWTLFHPASMTPPSGLLTDDLTDELTASLAGKAELIVFPRQGRHLVAPLEYPLLFGLLDVLGPPDSPTGRITFAQALLAWLEDEIAALDVLELRLLLRDGELRLVATLEAAEGGAFERLLQAPAVALPVLPKPVDGFAVSTALPYTPLASAALPEPLRPIAASWSQWRATLAGPMTVSGDRQETAVAFYADDVAEARTAWNNLVDAVLAGAGGGTSIAWDVAFPSAETLEAETVAIPGTLMRIEAVNSARDGWQALLTASRGRGVLTLDLPFAFLRNALQFAPETEKPAP